SVAQHVECAAVIKLLADTVKQPRPRSCAERLPGLGLRRLYPLDDIRGEQGTVAVVVRGGVLVIEPTVGGEMLANLRLEGDLLVKAHWVGASIAAISRRS